MLASFLLLYLFTMLEGKEWCDSAPDEGTREFCFQIQEMDKMNRVIEASGTSSLERTIDSQPRTIDDCRDIPCICSFLKGKMNRGSCELVNGEVYAKALRKEYRMLSDDEMSRFNSAMWTIKRAGTYDSIARLHSRFASGTGAHAGPGFLPWHREFLKRFEIALKQVDPSVSLPYWDSVLDRNIPNPKDSVFWSDDLFGGAQSGDLRNGVFAWWMLENMTRAIRRNVGGRGAPFDENTVTAILNADNLSNILAFTAAKDSCPIPRTFLALEYAHGNPHIFVGGDMVLTASSANDPIFFLHHSFVDFIWETWRQRKQSEQSRENDYPQSNIACSSAAHFASSPMRPFDPLMNLEGLSSTYTDSLYSYAPRPSCSRSSPDCGSKYLFCDLSHGSPRCAAKIVKGGNCSGYSSGEPCCYEGACVRGICRPSSKRKEEREPITKPTTTYEELASPLPTGNEGNQFFPQEQKNAEKLTLVDCTSHQKVVFRSIKTNHTII